MLNDMRVYVLKDPQTYEIRYVGVTSGTLNQRLSQHINAAKNFQCRHVCHWINTLLQKGFRPIIEQIDEVDDSIWEQTEQFYIQFYKDQGCKLTNISKGGAGVVTAAMRSKSSMERSIQGHKKPIYQIDSNLNIVNTWDSASDACRALGYKQANIGNAICYNRSAYGYFWVKVSDYDGWAPKSSYMNPRGQKQIKIQSNL